MFMAMGCDVCDIFKGYRGLEQWIFSLADALEGRERLALPGWG